MSMLYIMFPMNVPCEHCEHVLRQGRTYGAK